MQNYKEELLTQISRNSNDKEQAKRNSYLKGDTAIPFSDTYNPDFDRMQNQFKKYLLKEKVMQTTSRPEDFSGNPMKRNNHSVTVSLHKILFYRIVDL